MPSTLTLVLSATVILIPLGNREKDRMRFAEAQVELVALHRRLETDALDFEVLDVTGGNTRDHIIHKATRETVKGLDGAVLGVAGESNFFVGDGGLDLTRQRVSQFSLRAFDRDGTISGDVDLDLIRDRDALVSNT